MKRMVAILLVLGLLLAPLAAWAQPFSYGGYAQGVVMYSTASVSCSNTASACSLWSSTIPGALTATTANTNWSPSGVATPPGLHLTLLGALNTNVAIDGPGLMNLGVNYGGGVTGVATIALVNAYAPMNGLRSAPVQIDVWVSPIATGTSTSLPAGGAGYVFLRGRMTYAGAANTASIWGPAGSATETTFNAIVAGSTGGAFLASAEQLNVIVQWSSASATNSFNIYNGVLVFGN